MMEPNKTKSVFPIGGAQEGFQSSEAFSVGYEHWAACASQRAIRSGEPCSLIPPTIGGKT